MKKPATKSGKKRGPRLRLALHTLRILELIKAGNGIKELCLQLSREIGITVQPGSLSAWLSKQHISIRQIHEDVKNRALQEHGLAPSPPAVVKAPAPKPTVVPPVSKPFTTETSPSPPLLEGVKDRSLAERLKKRVAESEQNVDEGES